MININQNFKKIYLTFACALHLSSNLPLCADEFDLDDVNLERHRAHYNSLSSAKQADAALKSSPQFDEFLSKAQSIAKHYEVDSSMGLRLIHRHFALEEGQVMAENYEVVHSTPSFVTQPHTLEEAQERGTLPASWIFTDSPEEGGVLFETSSDPTIKTTSLKLRANPKFFEEMGNALREYKLNHILSIGILERKDLVAQENDWYIENTFIPDSRSVVQLRNIQEKPLGEGVVRTSWAFKEPKKHGCSCWWVSACYVAVCGGFREHKD